MTDTLTLAEVRALSWALKRANENSAICAGYGPGIPNPDERPVFTRSGNVHPSKAYNERVKLARRALRKVHELRRQGY